MKSIKKYLIMTLIMWGFVFAVPFLTNGDFEEPFTFTTGWLYNGTYVDYCVNRGVNYDPDPDYEVYIHTHGGFFRYLKLYQTVDIPTTDLEFSVNAKLYAVTYCHPWSWAGAAVVVSYLDESNSVLGETMICYSIGPCPWTNTDTSHIIEVTDSLWYSYAFNIEDELANLSGVNQSEIARIQVALYIRMEWC